MPIRTIAKFLAVAVLSLATAANAQTSRSDPSDFQTWYSTTAKLDLPNRWEASLKYRARLVDNSSVFRGSYLYTELGRELNEHLSLLGEYRLARVEDGTYHRYSLGMEASRELGRLDLSFRPVMQ